MKPIFSLSSKVLKILIAVQKFWCYKHLLCPESVDDSLQKGGWTTLKEGDLFQRSVIQQFGANGEKNNPDVVIITINKE